jgi:hypothetical protein
MIEMQVRVDDDVHILRPDSVPREIVRQSRSVLDPVYVRIFGIELIADAGFDQDFMISGQHEQASERQPNPVSFIGRKLLFPEGLGHDAKHLAAVQGKGPV